MNPAPCRLFAGSGRPRSDVLPTVQRGLPAVGGEGVPYDGRQAHAVGLHAQVRVRRGRRGVRRGRSVRRLGGVARGGRRGAAVSPLHHGGLSYGDLPGGSPADSAGWREEAVAVGLDSSVLSNIFQQTCPVNLVKTISPGRTDIVTPLGRAETESSMLPPPRCPGGLPPWEWRETKSRSSRSWRRRPPLPLWTDG